MTYKLELTKQAQKSLDILYKSQPKIAKRLIAVMESITQDPHLGIPLVGELKGLWKYRVGSYRIIYSIQKKKLIITIIDMGHRKEIYR